MTNINNYAAEIFSNAVKNSTIPKETEVVSQQTTNFNDVMENAILKVNESQLTADGAIESLIKGEDISMHEVMLAVQESQMSMQLMLEVRNKMYDAYQELNRVQM
ncbi:MAG: flagellar hook-basal body complex protein FliE [Peptostreptococcaceae bacterium]